MKFSETSIQGTFLIEFDQVRDERGFFFARSWCRDEFQSQGLVPNMVQSNATQTKLAGCIRGLHLQIHPNAEAKPVRCPKGSVFDVIVDLRPASATYLDWLAIELSADNRKQIYIPEGCAHGYQTLCDDTEVFYQVTEFYAPDNEKGIRWDDPKFEINWPLPVSRMSKKDLALPNFRAGMFTP